LRKILVVFMQIVGNRENYDSAKRLRNEKPIPAASAMGICGMNVSFMAADQTVE
jgi:hypothetical protein